MFKLTPCAKSPGKDRRYWLEVALWAASFDWLNLTSLCIFITQSLPDHFLSPTVFELFRRVITRYVCNLAHAKNTKIWLADLLRSTIYAIRQNVFFPFKQKRSNIFLHIIAQNLEGLTCWQHLAVTDPLSVDQTNSSSEGCVYCCSRE